MKDEIEKFVKENDGLLFGEESLKQFEVDYEFAVRTNQLEGLLAPFKRLNGMAKNSLERSGYESHVHIYTDFAKHSYYFNWSRKSDGARIMNGGIIYHGQLEDGGREETYSVELTPSNSWSIHT